MSTASIQSNVERDAYDLPNNCYAELRLPRSWGTHDASTHAEASRDVGINTDPIFSEEEKRVVELLELQYRIYGRGADPQPLALLDDQHHDVNKNRVTSTNSLRVVEKHGAEAEEKVEEDTNPPFAKEVPIPQLLDALWYVRYRPLVIQQLELRRQRAAKVAAHKAKKRAASPNGAVSPTMSLQGGLGGAGASATSYSAAATTGRTTTSPLAMPLWIPAALGGPSTSSAAVPAMYGATSPMSDNLSLAASNTSFGFGDGQSSTTSTAFFRQLLIPAEDLIPKEFPLTSLRTALRGATNKTLRSLIPTLENISSLYKSSSCGGSADDHDDGDEIDVTERGRLPNSVRPEASSATYFGRESVCRCVLDLIPLCPNIRSVSIAYHHAPPETLRALVRILEGQHPSLSTVDLRGNVLEIPVARAVARALRSNPRLTSFEFDKGNRLLPSTEKLLRGLVKENAAKMRTVSTMRSEWTQTTLLPCELPQDLSEYFAKK